MRAPPFCLALAVASSGCTGLFTSLDAGFDAGEPDAGLDAGSDAGTDAGAADAGSDAGFDAGEPDAGPAVYGGDGGALSFVQVVHPLLKIYKAVHGTRAAVYAGGTDGTVVVCSTGAVPTCALAVTNLSAGVVESLWVSPGGRVFAATSFGLYDCQADCTQAASWHFFSVPFTDMAGVCGASETEVFGVGTWNNTGSLDGAVWKFGASGWTKLGAVPSTGLVYGCTVSGGAVFLAATGQLGRFDLPSGPGVLESFDYTGFGTSGSSMRWFAVHAVQGLVQAAGDNKWFAVRQDDAGWRLANQPPNFGSGLGPVRAIAGRFPVELFATGDSNQPDQQSLKFHPDAGWSFIPDLAPIDGYGLWALDDDTYWLVGQDNPGGTGTGVIYRARR